jgi:sodium-dependent dicarboxylate transporter 2/3/5
VFASQLNQIFPDAPEIGFFQWMKVGVPLVIFFLPLAWLFITRIALPVKKDKLSGGRELIDSEISKLGKASKGEKLTLLMFIMTALGWIFRQDIQFGLFTIPGWSRFLGKTAFVNDSTVAIFAAVLLFVIPVSLKKGQFLLDWDHARRIPWGILILFGGGIALAGGFEVTGLAMWVGSKLELFIHMPTILLILCVCLMLTFLTEVTSNTAISTIFMPILAATAVATKLHPLLLMVPAAMSASCAFMLPVATPPNAIVFASGNVTVPQMARTGFAMNLLGAILITLLVYSVAIPVFHIVIGALPKWAY